MPRVHEKVHNKGDKGCNRVCDRRLLRTLLHFPYH